MLKIGYCQTPGQMPGANPVSEERLGEIQLAGDGGG
jgi:hypothetical protein